MTFSPVVSGLIYLCVLSYVFCIMCFLWWSGKRGWDF
uniref:ATP synthase F0 subunit 8 n=1 Tax=Lutraria maxima TaxID=971267 RepID=A0A343S4N3_9BIVA|nr:ATP synthase F0 subunit 8 [Lutraria maxima]AUH21199.1 ATP synthase F0 subunit 8 [Lutraria maxima]